MKPAVMASSVANGYLTDGAWVLKGSAIIDSGYHPPFLPDSIVISFSGKDTANVFIDTVSTWFSRIRSYAVSKFVTASEAGAPDTLFSSVSPYTFAFQADTFLVKDLTDSMFVLEQYNLGTISAEIDTLRKSLK